MSNTTAPVPVAPSIAAVDLWLQIIPASSVPMAFASLAALIASALFGRWLSVLVRTFSSLSRPEPYNSIYYIIMLL
jgi:hypothetical protein